MKKSTPIILLFVFSCMILQAQSHFHTSNIYLKRKTPHQYMESQSSGFGVWENNYGAIGGGVNYEFGGALPLINLNQRFYFMLDGYGRLSSIKKTAFGLGGTAAAEIRFYNAPQPYANYGLEFSWGVNMMLYSFGKHDDLHLLYGSNWMRLGIIDNVGTGNRMDVQYFAQFQYWKGSWYSSVGVELDAFNKMRMHVRGRF